MDKNCCGHLQLPRLYNVYKEQGIIENFEQLLDNIFQPLFEVTKDPNSHPQLHLFLKNVSSPAFQCLSMLNMDIMLSNALRLYGRLYALLLSMFAHAENGYHAVKCHETALTK